MSSARGRETVDSSCEVCKEIWCVIHDGAGGSAAGARSVLPASVKRPEVES